MNVRIGKDFIWEMSHRLPFHKGPCKNIHGHSYKMRVELIGSLNENAMVLDFYDISKVIQPLIDQIDHAFICDTNDDLMIEFLKANGFKYYIVDGFSTAESMSIYFMNQFKPKFANFSNIRKIRIRIYETSDAFAEVESEF